MQVKFEILNKGDSVLNVWENNIAITKKNGDVEIVQFNIGKDGLPRLSNNSILITQGNGVVRIKNDDSSAEIGTF